MKFSPQGFAFLKRLEGCKLTAYFDEGGKPTIGFGHAVGVTAEDVHKGTTITEAEAEELLRSDVLWAEGAVNRRARVLLTQWQFDALVCLTYNIGRVRWKLSTVAQRLDAKDFEGAADAFRMWIKIDGQVNSGLMKRREAEIVVFKTGKYPEEPYV